MSVMWLAILVIYSLAVGHPAPGLDWLLLIPLFLQDGYDAGKKQ